MTKKKEIRMKTAEDVSNEIEERDIRRAMFLIVGEDKKINPHVKESVVAKMREHNIINFKETIELRYEKALARLKRMGYKDVQR